MPQIFPGNGAGSLGPLISLFRGWGVDFRILLDSDKAGEEGKRRYIREFLLAEHEVVTLGDIAPSLKGKAFEAIYGGDVREAAKSKYKATKLGKKELSLFFQELIASKDELTFSETEAAFIPISEWMDAEYGPT